MQPRTQRRHQPCTGDAKKHEKHPKTHSALNPHEEFFAEKKYSRTITLIIATLLAFISPPISYSKTRTSGDSTKNDTINAEIGSAWARCSVLSEFLINSSTNNTETNEFKEARSIFWLYSVAANGEEEFKKTQQAERNNQTKRLLSLSATDPASNLISYRRYVTAEVNACLKIIDSPAGENLKSQVKLIIKEKRNQK